MGAATGSSSRSLVGKQMSLVVFGVHDLSNTGSSAFHNSMKPDCAATEIILWPQERKETKWIINY